VLKTIAIVIIAVFLIECSAKNSFAQTEVEITPAQLKDMATQLSVISPARNYKNINSLEAASSFIKKQLISFGYSPYEQEFTVNGQEYSNIIASRGANDAPVFVVGAHYDVCGNQPGADDNASGVAGLLKLAQLVAQNNPKLSYRLEFVAYTLEEPPFFRTKHMGSYIHAKSLYEQKVDVIGMASLEMIGFFSNEKKSQEYPISIMKLFYPTKGDFIAIVGNFRSSKLIKHFFSNMKW